MAWNRVYRLLDNIISLNENQITNEILSDKGFQEFIISLNTEGEDTSQLFEHGIDSLGVSLSDIGGDYSPVTLELSAKKGRPKASPSLIDLKDTGAFYKSFKIVLSSKSFKITADTNKDDTDLLEEWGRNIIGLTDENLQIVIDAIKRKIIPIIRSKIFS